MKAGEKNLEDQNIVEEGMNEITVLQSKIGDFAYLLSQSLLDIERFSPHIERKDQLIYEEKNIDSIAKELVQKIANGNKDFVDTLENLRGVLKRNENVDEEIEELQEKNLEEEKNLLDAHRKLELMRNDVSEDLRTLSDFVTSSKFHEKLE